MHISELDTPALLVDLDRMEKNIVTMVKTARANKVLLRPHTKTHKCPAIAKQQLAAGATGITCAKIGEAEVMVDAGLTDILIANQIIGELKFKRLIQLTQRTKICVAVDSEYGATTLNGALAAANSTIDILVEINCGQNRAGLLPGAPVLDLVKKIGALPQLNFKGLMTHGGHSYNLTTKAEIEKTGLEEGRVMVETANLLRENSIRVETVSAGSTPTAKYCATVPGITEIRPGTYIFCDRTQVELFACEHEDCALSVFTTVTSTPAEDRAIIDAGKKVLTSDPAGRTGRNSGYGLIQEKNVEIAGLSEEHGIIRSDAKFQIGERVRVTPNHVCVVVNMFDKMYGIRNEQVEKTFKIAGRGQVL